MFKNSQTPMAQPMALPVYEQIQDLASCFNVAFFSKTAAVTSAVLPVKSSAPQVRMMSSA